MMSAPIRVLCVDDHAVVLEGITTVVARQVDMAVIASATSGEQAVHLFRAHAPDVTLMDLQLPGISGLEAIRQIRSEAPQARIIVLTMYQGDEDISRALSAGAATYLLKDVRSDELLHVIREVHAGGGSLPANIASRLATRERESHLTGREIEVVTLIAKGMRNKEIAIALDVTEHTAKMHVKNLLAKLGVNDRAGAIAVAFKRGFIHL